MVVLSYLVIESCVKSGNLAKGLTATSRNKIMFEYHEGTESAKMAEYLSLTDKLCSHLSGPSLQPMLARIVKHLFSVILFVRYTTLCITL